MSICHYTDLAITKFNIKSPGLYGPPDSLSINGNVSKSPPAQISQTQPNHRNHLDESFAYPQNLHYLITLANR